MKSMAFFSVCVVVCSVVVWEASGGPRACLRNATRKCFSGKDLHQSPTRFSGAVFQISPKQIPKSPMKPSDQERNRPAICITRRNACFSLTRWKSRIPCCSPLLLLLTHSGLTTSLHNSAPSGVSHLQGLWPFYPFPPPSSVTLPSLKQLSE